MKSYRAKSAEGSRQHRLLMKVQHQISQNFEHILPKKDAEKLVAETSEEGDKCEQEIENSSQLQESNSSSWRRSDRKRAKSAEGSQRHRLLMKLQQQTSQDFEDIVSKKDIERQVGEGSDENEIYGLELENTSIDCKRSARKRTWIKQRVGRRAIPSPSPKRMPSRIQLQVQLTPEKVGISTSAPFSSNGSLASMCIDTGINAHATPEKLTISRIETSGTSDETIAPSFSDGCMISHAYNDNVSVSAESVVRNNENVLAETETEVNGNLHVPLFSHPSDESVGPNIASEDWNRFHFEPTMDASECVHLDSADIRTSVEIAAADADADVATAVAAATDTCNREHSENIDPSGYEGFEPVSPSDFKLISTKEPGGEDADVGSRRTKEDACVFSSDQFGFEKFDVDAARCISNDHDDDDAQSFSPFGYEEFETLSPKMKTITSGSSDRRSGGEGGKSSSDDVSTKTRFEDVNTHDSRTDDCTDFPDDIENREGSNINLRNQNQNENQDELDDILDAPSETIISSTTTDDDASTDSDGSASCTVASSFTEISQMDADARRKSNTLNNDLISESEASIGSNINIEEAVSHCAMKEVGHLGPLPSQDIKEVDKVNVDEVVNADVVFTQRKYRNMPSKSYSKPTNIQEVDGDDDDDDRIGPMQQIAATYSMEDRFKSMLHKVSKGQEDGKIHSINVPWWEDESKVLSVFSPKTVERQYKEEEDGFDILGLDETINRVSEFFDKMCNFELSLCIDDDDDDVKKFPAEIRDNLIGDEIQIDTTENNCGVDDELTLDPNLISDHTLLMKQRSHI